MTDLNTATTAKPDSNFWKVFLCALFLGAFGVHRFITGNTKSGIVQLLTFGFCGIWAIVDLVTILLGKFKGKDGELISNPNPKKTWSIAAVTCAIGLVISNGNSGSGKTSNGLSGTSIKSGTKVMTVSEAKRSGSLAKDWARNRIEQSTHSKVIQIDEFGWDPENNCHVFGGLIDSSRSGKYMQFDIRVGIDSSGQWSVQKINITNR